VRGPLGRGRGVWSRRGGPGGFGLSRGGFGSSLSTMAVAPSQSSEQRAARGPVPLAAAAGRHYGPRRRAAEGDAIVAKKQWDNVLVEVKDGIGWVTLNRPTKRNAMSPALNRDMLDVLDHIETDPACGVMVLTGASDSFSAGMDLKEYFREVDKLPEIERMRARRDAYQWQWHRLMYFPKPTIAMVNGWCFGGAFTPLVSCDLSIAAEDAIFGLSEINWGIIPGGNVTKAFAAKVPQADALYYIMTGETFDGRKAAAMRLVNEAVPKTELRARTEALAQVLLGKNPTVLRTAKTAYKFARDMNWDVSEDYLMAKGHQASFTDPERGREKGLTQFLDDKSYRPGLGAYDRSR
jgi:trans-feruloyl-CoA hydratase/vanillin synthase